MNYIKNFFGWKDCPNPPKEPCVLVFCHTSYWDAFVAMLYIFAYNGRNIYCVTQPKLAKWYYYPFAKLLHAIFAPPNEQKNSNSLKSIVSQFQSKPTSEKAKRMLIIAPKGTCAKREWRSGYYYIAKELNYKVYPYCMDLTNREIHFGEPVDPSTMSLEECTNNLQQQLSKYRVMNMENAEMEIKECCGCPYESLFPFDMCLVSLLFFIPYLINCYTIGLQFQFIISLINVLFAYVYHYEKEGTIHHHVKMKYYQKIEGNMAKFCVTSHILYNLYTFGHLTNMFYILFFTGLFFYFNSIPRGFSRERGKYAILHPIHHIFLALSAYELSLQCQ